MYSQNISPLKSAQQGVVVIEAMIAILIFSFAVLGVIGLQASMIKNTSESKYRADASYIAQREIGLLWTDPGDIANSPELGIHDISNLMPGGSMDVVQLASGQIMVTVNWQAPGDPIMHNFTTVTNITESKVAP